MFFLGRGHSRTPCLTRSSSFSHAGPQACPQVAERKKKKKTEQSKAANAGLEGFVDWTNSRVSESAEEEEANMSYLVFGFAVRMCK